RRGGREKALPPILPGAKWAMINKKYLLNRVGGHLGEEWEMLVERWWDLEKSTNFITSVKSHATKNHPAEVHEWVKAACRGSPEINDVEAFGKQWWLWWKGLNPEWRLQGGILVREGTGDWGGLVCPGTNRFMNIVVCLKWWGTELVTKGQPTEGWLDAVRDVMWVLEKM
ncbi:hypothetical protein C8J57DRAFT_1026729, partial [Mycena rebaudengoi]